VTAPVPAGQSTIAVVVPVHNGARYLAEALRSVRAQTRPAAEVIVVDDGSDDASGAVAEQGGARCIRQENAGPGAARNRGLAAASCELVAFLDADDLFEPSKLAQQAAVLEADPRVPAVCSDARILGGPRDGRRKNERPVPSRLGLLDLLAGNPVVASSVLARREAVLAAGGFDEDRALIATEDYDLWLRLVELGPIHYVDEPLVAYRVHGGSLSNSERFLSGVDRAIDKVLRRHPGDARIAAAAAARRSDMRLDAAYDAARAGDGRRARSLLREARRLQRSTAKGWKIWLRSWL
jgi:glycosyltransferase involved in cell wall biosynthesis